MCCMNNDSISEVMNTFSLLFLNFFVSFVGHLAHETSVMFLVFSLDVLCVFNFVLLYFFLMVVIMFVPGLDALFW